MTDPDTTHERAERIAASIRDSPASEERSRRSFMSRSALAGGALVGLAGATGIGIAQDDDGGSEEPAGATFDDAEGTDVDVLNYALTLEHLEDAFYEQGLEMFSEEDFANADALQSFPEETRHAVYGHVQTVEEHESSHVEVLTQAVNLLGGTPVERANYDFGVENVGNFLSLGRTFENTGVAAYAGAAPYIESPDLLSAALSIHSVEARHAAVFNYLLGESPFPMAFDEALSQQEVLEAIGPIIQSMPDDGGDSGNGNGGNGGDGGGDDGSNGDGGGSNGGDDGNGGGGGNQSDS